MAKGKTSSHLGTYPLNSLSRSFTSDAHISIAEKLFCSFVLMSSKKYSLTAYLSWKALPIAPRGAQTAAVLPATNCCKSFRLQSNSYVLNKYSLLTRSHMSPWIPRSLRYGFIILYNSFGSQTLILNYSGWTSCRDESCSPPAQDATSPLKRGGANLSIPKIGLQKIEINCNPNLVQNDNKT